ncbi:MAG: hypothetical protein AMS22_03825 [Thiotrichales bacterium SG8_50]|nr:MAG: hypothetical protein AMS22_03825 [Thiotrichales bacterium SG8_50]
MRPIGIIANPASGKDIRRLVASGTVFSNQEKINIIVRAILAMDAMGVERVVIMPDPSHMAERVIKKLRSRLSTTCVEVLELPYLLGTWQDTVQSVGAMRDLDCASVVVMGGDGTSRVAAKASDDMPLIPVSTGTNNVFPQLVEGTLVGLAAAAVATGAVASGAACARAPRLELSIDGEFRDIALVDLAVVDAANTAARAVWDPLAIKEIFLTCVSASNIGLSAIGGFLPGVEIGEDEMLHVTLGDGGLEVMAPIAPGLLSRLSVTSYEKVRSCEVVRVSNRSAMVALDGEREIAILDGQDADIRLSRRGPVVVNIHKALRLAVASGNYCRDLPQSFAVA